MNHLFTAFAIILASYGCAAASSVATRVRILKGGDKDPKGQAKDALKKKSKLEPVKIVEHTPKEPVDKEEADPEFGKWSGEFSPTTELESMSMTITVPESLSILAVVDSMPITEEIPESSDHESMSMILPDIIPSISLPTPLPDTDLEEWPVLDIPSETLSMATTIDTYAEWGAFDTTPEIDSAFGFSLSFSLSMSMDEEGEGDLVDAVPTSKADKQGPIFSKAGKTTKPPASAGKALKVTATAEVTAADEVESPETEVVELYSTDEQIVVAPLLTPSVGNRIMIRTYVLLVSTIIGALMF